MSRAAVHAVVKLCCLLVVLAPVWLGPATMPVIRALGGVQEHHCMCGMKMGECHCPECEALAHERLLERRATPYPVIHSTCDTDPPAPAPALPTCSPAGLTAELAPLPRVVTVTRAPQPLPLRSRGPDEPPTPPPRALAA